VTGCACLIESFRRSLDDGAVLEDDAARERIRAASTDKCQLQGVSAAAPRASANQGRPPSSSQPEGTTRPLTANSPEVCLQDKITEASKKGDVPIETFERFQRECGL